MANVSHAMHAPTHTPVMAQVVAAWQDYTARRRERAQIIRELGAYTDRELAELGFYRQDIPAIANGTYRR